MTFESEGLLIVAIYIWLPPASYVVFSDNSGLSALSPKNGYKGINIHVTGTAYTFKASQYMNGYHFPVKFISMGPCILTRLHT